MRLYTYLIEVIPDGTQWGVVLHRSTGDRVFVLADTSYRRIVKTARRMGQSIAEQQGRNLRLELQVRDGDGNTAYREHFGADPRSVTWKDVQHG